MLLYERERATRCLNMQSRKGDDAGARTTSELARAKDVVLLATEHKQSPILRPKPKR